MTGLVRDPRVGGFRDSDFPEFTSVSPVVYTRLVKALTQKSGECRLPLVLEVQTEADIGVAPATRPTGRGS
jgi:hypothetical protein